MRGHPGLSADGLEGLATTAAGLRRPTGERASARAQRLPYRPTPFALERRRVRHPPTAPELHSIEEAWHVRIIAIEEHCRTGEIAGADITSDRRWGSGPMQARMAMLDDLGDARLTDMDAAGIDVQVLSQTSPAAEAFEGPDAIRRVREANDRLAEAVAAHPDRFRAFAALPTSAPEEAAKELERAVHVLGFKGALINGRPQGRFMDDLAFSPIFAQAEALDVPIYLHPAPPPVEVREAYYEGFGPAVGQALATAGWGWHIETGLHALRLILGGVFDRFPRLRIVIGHMGEALPFMLARSDALLTPVAGLQRPVREYFTENFYITTSGFFTQPPLLCALMVMGADRIIFSVDYPFSDNDQGRAFLDAAPISPADREKIAHGNVERLLGL